MRYDRFGMQCKLLLDAVLLGWKTSGNTTWKAGKSEGLQYRKWLAAATARGFKGNPSDQDWQQVNRAPPNPDLFSDIEGNCTIIVASPKKQGPVTSCALYSNEKWPGCKR